MCETVNSGTWFYCTEECLVLSDLPLGSPHNHFYWLNMESFGSNSTAAKWKVKVPVGRNKRFLLFLLGGVRIVENTDISSLSIPNNRQIPQCRGSDPSTLPNVNTLQLRLTATGGSDFVTLASCCCVVKNELKRRFFSVFLWRHARF